MEINQVVGFQPCLKTRRNVFDDENKKHEADVAPKLGTVSDFCFSAITTVSQVRFWYPKGVFTNKFR